MNETMVCVVGNVATQPVYRETATGASARFRLAVTQRYWDREKNGWTDGHTNFFTVWTKRALATNVQASVTLGDPVVVQGRLKVRSEQRDGQSWTYADIEASALGHDLSRGTAAFRRASKGEAASAATSRPEPNWETGTGARPDAAAQQQPEPALVT
ncbi:single-stranded DNA-binding protein [Streptomyces sporangiiformans]|uniref:Single-stranded DNA-binding protein n=1 Tax=Streptomyces sporangiiformans TaxID=2315329 RepID=A0A505D4X6_9ACTN|nr:single-stranded DNA-binding protein [Streptomyces sporangiiformans]TPQ15808.1 single-stranded DNA-binding protein [Streptomyces sporangiiformans]